MILQEKLASIGQLAAGLAHELNNPINFVRINFATLQEDIADIRELLQEYRNIRRIAEKGSIPPEKLQELREKEKEIAIDTLLDGLPEIFTESQRGFERIGTIIGSMRNFSFRHAIDQRVPFDINKGINDTLIIARNEYRYYADVETSLEILPPIPCNPEQINQVFLNLIINSAHAIASQKRAEKGKIRLTRLCQSASNPMATIEAKGHYDPHHYSMTFLMWNMFDGVKIAVKGHITGSYQGLCPSQ